jgi:hypothetical protein
MKLMLDIDVSSKQKISYRDKLLLIGSCFTDEIGDRLASLKFNILRNPNGIVYDPISISNSIISYIEKKEYKEEDLFHHNELWHSWQHHSKFSGTNREVVLSRINQSQNEAHQFLKEANWLILTLGTSFHYSIAETSEMVANCHKMPATTFNKSILPANETISSLNKMFERLHSFNRGLKILLTVSPVRHIRDGVVENNISKARLLDAVHTIIADNTYGHIQYFPAYELVIDILRDYRFYERDLVHPNNLATDYVFERFTTAYLDNESSGIKDEIDKWIISEAHRAFNTDTASYVSFRKAQQKKHDELKNKYPFIKW